MKTNRGTCEKKLKPILYQYNAKRVIKQQIIDKFKEHGIFPGDVSDIFSQNTPIETLSTNILCLLTKYLYEETKEESINYNEFFTEFEINQAVNYKEEKKEEGLYPIIFENVIQDAAGDFSTTLPIARNAELINNRIFKYNPETQRPLISKFYSGKELKEIDLNKRSREAITRNIVNGTQIPNTVTINLLQTGEENFEYNAKSQTLTIYSGEIDMIDGYHRILSAWFAYNEKPSLEFYYKLRIVNWDVEKAKAFIFQETLGNKIDPTKAKSYNVNNPYNVIVNKLNENPKSNIRGKITNDKMDITNNKALIMFNVIFDAIQHMFEVKDNSQIVEVSNYLKDGINLIIDNNVDILKAPQEDILWVAYICILKRYYNKDDWQGKGLSLVEKINIEELKQIPFRSINKILINKIEKYLSEKEMLLSV